MYSRERPGTASDRCSGSAIPSISEGSSDLWCRSSSNEAHESETTEALQAALVAPRQRTQTPRTSDTLVQGSIPGGMKRPSTAVQPPSAKSTEPVTKLDASDARNSVGPTISSARAHRLKTLLAE